MSATGVRRPARADARRNYDLLLSKAHDVFTEHGTDASLEEIARRAGLGIGTLYRHFPTRDALVEALLRDRFEAMRQAAERVRDEPPYEALAQWLRKFTAGAATYQGLPASVVAIMRQPGSELYASCHGMRDAGLELIARAQQAHVIRDDLKPTDVLALVGAIAWVGQQTPEDAGQPDRLLALVLDALTAPMKARPTA